MIKTSKDLQQQPVINTNRFGIRAIIARMDQPAQEPDADTIESIIEEGREAGYTVSPAVARYIAIVEQFDGSYNYRTGIFTFAPQSLIAEAEPALQGAL